MAGADLEDEARAAIGHERVGDRGIEPREPVLVEPRLGRRSGHPGEGSGVPLSAGGRIRSACR